MSEPQKKFYLTTPIYYVNARPHIGHAYTTIAADVIARRHRLLGDDTFLLTGTDEHGQKIERSAAAAGIPPQQFADQVSASFKALWDRMGITYNDYIRTTDPRHKRGVQKLWKTLADRGAIYLSTYTGQYSIGEEMFVEGPPGTIGPDGKPTETVTEENYFFKLSDYQLRIIDLIESNQLLIQPEVRRNEVLSFLRGNVNEAEKNAVIASEASATSLSPEALPPALQSTVAYSAAGTPYVPGALKDLSISRSSFKWGIPVPGDEKHVVYVWLDALANYMTAIGYGSDDPKDQATFEKYWPADLHLVGKEIIRFHCVYWPAFLMAANLPLPKAITAHGWLLFQDSSNQATKMSKSKGNIVRTETILDAFGTLCPPTPSFIVDPTQNSVVNPIQNTVILSEASQPHREAQSKDPERLDPTTTAQTFPPQNSALLKGTASAVPQTSPSENAALAAEVRSPSKREQDLFASDILRYFLLREIPFGQDGSFSFDALVTRYNADLANGYGNLVSRTLNMIHKYFDGQLPQGKMDPRIGLGLQIDVAAITNNYAEYDFSSLLHNIMNIVRAADGHITSTAPWKLTADENRQEELRNVLYTAAECIRIINTLVEPILPFTAAQVFAQLGIHKRDADGEPLWGDGKLGPLTPIFPRAPKELIQLMTDMENPTTPAPTEPEAPKSAESAPSAVAPAVASEPATETTPQIAIDDFVKIDLRVAKILVAERIPKADKLLRLEVDLGYETRQILSGIAEWYTPEELIGRKIVIIANLAPRKMRGLESHGMLLAASHGENGKPILATFNEDIAPGSRLK